MKKIFEKDDTPSWRRSAREVPTKPPTTVPEEIPAAPTTTPKETPTFDNTNSIPDSFNDLTGMEKDKTIKILNSLLDKYIKVKKKTTPEIGEPKKLIASNVGYNRFFKIFKQYLGDTIKIEGNAKKDELIELIHLLRRVGPSKMTQEQKLKLIEILGDMSGQKANIADTDNDKMLNGIYEFYKTVTSSKPL